MIEDIPTLLRDSLVPYDLWSNVLHHSELLVTYRYGLAKDSFVSFYHLKAQNIFLCQTGVTMSSGPLLITLYARNRQEFEKEINDPHFLSSRFRKFALELALGFYRQKMN